MALPLQIRAATVLTAQVFAGTVVSVTCLASTSAAQTGTTAAATSQPVTDLGGYRLPLLREGSIIARVEGDLAQDPDEKLWLFRPTKPEAGGLRREFVLMPSPTFEDMLQTVRVSAVPVEFELTGRVFIYRGRNFLLPELATPIVRFDTRPGETPKLTDGSKVAPSGEAKFVAPPSTGADADDAAVEEIERRLEERIGRVPSRRVPDQTTIAPPKVVETPPIASGTRFTLRRGRLLRDPQAGSWRFVPEQMSGGSSGDSSLEILPCLLLEQLEIAARESDSPPVVLLSGVVLGFEGKSFLLPSTFRRAREGRGLGG